MFTVTNNNSEVSTFRKPFKGIHISATTIFDAVPADEAAIIAGLIDPWKIRVELINERTNRVVFNESLMQMFLRTRKYDRDLEKLVSGLSTERGYYHDDLATGNKALIQDYSIELDTYEGDYTLRVTPEAGAFQAGTITNSFLSVEFELSDAPMEFEAIYLDKNLDKTLNDFELGSGIEEVMVCPNFSMTKDDFDLFIGRNVKMAIVNHQHGKTTRNGALLLASNFRAKESGPEALTYPYVIHDEETLGNCAVSLELIQALGVYANAFNLVYKRLLPAPGAEASDARAQNRAEATWNLIEQGQ